MWIFATPFAVRAQEFTANGFVDFGLGAPTAQTSWMRGGFGKLGLGDDGGAVIPFGQAVTDLRAQLGSSFSGFTTLRVAPDQHAPVDIVEAYARYQPISSPSLLWSMKLGAFFPPISLENEATGWTSPWTLTPSAINSWVGDELRTIGGESLIEWRYDGGAVGLQGAVFGWNDPAGALVADRGWAFDTRPTGLFGEPRIPDALASEFGDPVPLREEPFKQIGAQPGWYGGATMRQNGLGRAALLYYDNRANPALHDGSDFAWRTHFTSLGLESDIGDVVLLSQAMFGQTTIAPAPNFTSTTDFQSVYLLAGYYFDDFRIAGRVDLFATQQHNTGSASSAGEHGHALTFAGTWTPVHWLRLTAELLMVDSYRSAVLTPGSGPTSSKKQVQLVARVLF
jgi:hypothetical protein